MIRTATVVALAVAAVASMTAWRIQASAADALTEARRIQAQEVPEEGAPPPSPEQYRKILSTLERSIAIRTNIERRIADVERTVFSLHEQQRKADALTDQARRRLGSIAAILGGASRAGRRSVARLDALQERLEVSARLARAIAEELEELDRSLGPPTIARPR